MHLFATLARDPRLCKKFFAGGLLDKGNLTVRQRELVIDRTAARCRSEYEWGVHVAVFAEQAGLSGEQIHSTVRGSADDDCWSEEDRLLLRLCDALHRDCDIDDELWDALSASFTENAIIELLVLAGFYRTISYLTNGLRMPLERVGARFPIDRLPEHTRRTADPLPRTAPEGVVAGSGHIAATGAGMSTHRRCSRWSGA